MKRVLILGAGMVARPIVRHLLSDNIFVTIATPGWTRANAESMIQGFANAAIEDWTVDDSDKLGKMVAAHDVAVSLLPYVYHLKVAGTCLAHGKHMVTTSYVKPEMKALDAEAKAKGILLLNEIGLDPGIDHMSAQKIIDQIHAEGGMVDEFFSVCGALPAPEAADNPFRYRFSWSPKGVVLAGNNDAVYLRDGVIRNIPTEKLFRDVFRLEFPGAGVLDVYPNRDSLSYTEIYGIPETRTMFRGTFRYPGWCAILDAMKKIRLISPEERDFTGMTYRSFTASLAGITESENFRHDLAQRLGVDENGTEISAFEWLGLFDEAPMERGLSSAFEITSDLMIDKMMLRPDQRDMVAMMHLFVALMPDGTKRLIRSSMLDFGTAGGDTSVARTVALPAAIAVQMILSGDISVRGVHIPVIPSIYTPVLAQLEKLGIAMKEEFGLPMSLKP
jgi:saccharopine dehydrogenase-like NADP-dependent oxidoreductase